MMDLITLQDTLIGVMGEGGMSFEQRKRVSIAVELAANPSVLFLDEPTTGLDSRAAQALIRNIRTVAASGRSVVCTIHQPSTAIFNSFDSLLLLRRGGQTVFFGELGENSSNLIAFFQAAPNVTPMQAFVNPATWMLEQIGAGTSVAKDAANVTDFHAYYNGSSLCEINKVKLDGLTVPNDGSIRYATDDLVDKGDFNASYVTQFRWLMHRIHLTYWRSPGYTIGRHFVMLLIALIFGSAYPKQEYHTNIAVVSRSAVIYITALFCGVLAMLNIVPMASSERPVFYREQQSRMYSVAIFTSTQYLIEIPYLLLASLSFTLPFFFIVGFDNIGNVTEKFFWYWFFNFLLQSVMLFFVHVFCGIGTK